VQNWCLDNGTKLDISKTTIIFFTRKINSNNFEIRGSHGGENVDDGFLGSNAVWTCG
jgi:hypothetical protein